MAKRWWWCVLDLTNRSFIRSFMISDPATRFGCVPGFHSRIREAPKQASKVRQRFVETHRAGHEAGGEDQDRQRKIILPTTVRPCPPPLWGPLPRLIVVQGQGGQGPRDQGRHARPSEVPADHQSSSRVRGQVASQGQGACCTSQDGDQRTLGVRSSSLSSSSSSLVLASSKQQRNVPPLHCSHVMLFPAGVRMRRQGRREAERPLLECFILWGFLGESISHHGQPARE